MASKRSEAASVVRLALIVASTTIAAESSAAPLEIQKERVTVRQGATLELEVEPVAAGKLQVLTRDGDALEPLPNAVQTEAGMTSKVSIPKETPVMIRKQSAQPAMPTPLTIKETSVDAVLVESVPVAGATNVRDIRQWTLVISASQTPLVWNATRRAYTTEVLIRLKELGGAQGHKPSEPVTVQLVGRGVALEPQMVWLSEAGVSGIQRALVSLTNHRGKGTVEAISDFGEQSYEVGAEAQLASIHLTSSLTAIPGFGIGTTQLSAVRLAEDGRELSSPSPLSIILTSSGGRLGSPELLIPANSSHSQVVELRSSWLGDTQLRASVDGIDAKPLDVTFSTPWSYLIAIMLGAGLGSFVRLRPKRKLQMTELFSAIAVGLILGLGSFIGISSVGVLPTTAVVTEIGCLVVAAIEAYLGRAALDRFAGRAAPPMPNPKPV